MKNKVKPNLFLLLSFVPFVSSWFKEVLDET